MPCAICLLEGSVPFPAKAGGGQVAQPWSLEVQRWTVALRCMFPTLFFCLAPVRLLRPPHPQHTLKTLLSRTTLPHTHTILSHIHTHTHTQHCHGRRGIYDSGLAGVDRLGLMWRQLLSAAHAWPGTICVAGDGLLFRGCAWHASPWRRGILCGRRCTSCRWTKQWSTCCVASTAQHCHTNCNTNIHTRKTPQRHGQHSRIWHNAVTHHIVTHPIGTQTTFLTQDCHIRLCHTHTQHCHTHTHNFDQLCIIMYQNTHPPPLNNKRANNQMKDTVTKTTSHRQDCQGTTLQVLKHTPLVRQPPFAGYCEEFNICEN